MKVILAKNAGFCNGVKSAVNQAVSLAEKYGKIYTLGELVHNENVTDFLNRKGAICIKIEDACNLKKGDVALIRAHGITKQLEEELRDRGVVLFDATCPVVKRNQKIAEDRAKTGDDVIIVGDKNHDEVIGVASYAGENCKMVSDTEELPIGEKNTSILFQTTILPEKFEKIEENAKNFEKNTII